VPEQHVPQPPGPLAGLHEIARALREAPPLGPEAQQALAALIDELGNALESTPARPELEHLAGTTADLVRALHRRHDARGLAAARDRLEQAILGLEARAPVTAGIARRLLDALTGLGI
jgi:hypothetical protein